MALQIWNTKTHVLVPKWDPLPWWENHHSTSFTSFTGAFIRTNQISYYVTFNQSISINFKNSMTFFTNFITEISRPSQSSVYIGQFSVHKPRWPLHSSRALRQEKTKILKGIKKIKLCRASVSKGFIKVSYHYVKRIEW